jgi:hypothetical protein
MQHFKSVPNIAVDGDEFTAGFLGLDWLPSAGALASKRKYESEVLAILIGLLRTWTGWAVMNEISGVPKKMVIRPFHPTPKDKFNAYAAAQDVRAATMKGTAAAGWQGGGLATQNSPVITAQAGENFYGGYRIKIQGTRLGKPYSMSYKYRLDNSTKITLLAYSISGFPDDGNDAKWEGNTGTISWIIEGSPGQPAVIGTGTGSDTQIRFSRSTWTAADAPTGPGATPDEILLHEMVHGLRQMKGRAVFEQINGNPGMDNYEEFAAIVISNVYRSELKIPQLRQDHHGFLPLTGPDTAAASFKTTYQDYLVNMSIEQPQLCQNLRRVPCAFNPFV